MLVKTRPEPIIQKKKDRISLPPPVTAGHEFAVKFSKLPQPVIGEQQIHKITVRIDDPPLYVKLSMKKKQWNKLVKGVEAAGDSWIAAGRGRIQKIVNQTIYLQDVGFQVYERKPKGES